MLQFMKQLAIFIILGKTILHFCPSEKYEKYIKLLFGFMVVIQFITPVLAFGKGEDSVYEVRKTELEEQLEGALLAVEADWFSYNEEIEKQIAREAKEAEVMVQETREEQPQEHIQNQESSGEEPKEQGEDNMVQVEDIKIEVILDE